MRRPLLAVVPIALLPVLAVGCGSDGKKDEGASSSTTSAGQASTSTTAGGAGGTTSTTSASSSTTAVSNECRTDELTGSLGPTDAGAGQVYAPLVLRNGGSRTCTVKGFPGVSLLDGSGNQLGDPAGREGNEGAEVTLAPGAAASSTLHTTNQGIGGATCTPQSSQMKVYPPNQTAALIFPAQFTACGGFTVTTLVAGESGTA